MERRLWIVAFVVVAGCTIVGCGNTRQVTSEPTSQDVEADLDVQQKELAQ